MIFIISFSEMLGFKLFLEDITWKRNEIHTFFTSINQATRQMNYWPRLWSDVCPFSMLFVLMASARTQVKRSLFPWVVSINSILISGQWHRKKDQDTWCGRLNLLRNSCGSWGINLQAVILYFWNKGFNSFPIVISHKVTRDKKSCQWLIDSSKI